MRLLLFAAVLLVSVVRPVAAQFPPDLAVGSRVRITLPDSLRQVWGPRVQFLHGEVAAVATDTVYLKLQGTPSPLAIPRPSIKRIDRSLGMPSRPESALRGAAIGAFWLGILSAAEQRGDVRGEELGERLAIGAGIGFIVGALFPTERWQRIRFR